MSNPLSIVALRGQLCADLDFHGSDGRYSTHGWHPFPAKFPPQLPGYFIERLSKPGEVVFDPMSAPAPRFSRPCACAGTR